MSLLNVTVKKARFAGVQAQQFNSYVTLKLQNVKTTTVTVKGANPCWEQDFLFETNDINTGLLVEVWSKGMLWDSSLGYHYIPLPQVSYSNEVTNNQKQQSFLETQQKQHDQQNHSTCNSYDTNSNTQEVENFDTNGSGQWVSLDSELEMRGGEVVGTKTPTGHSLLIDCRFELPFDPENTEAADLQRKLEMLNNTMDQEARAEQARRQMLYNVHSGYSEDSDYTSDLNYPVGGQGANSSASQFRTAANQLATPQRSLETSRENSYERDDHQIPATVGGRLAAGSYSSYGGKGHSPRYDESYPEEGPPQRYSMSQQSAESSEPLFYNSRPRHYKEYRRRKHTWDYEDSQDGWYSEGYDYHGTKVDETRIYSDTEYYPSTTTSTSSRRRGPHRRPSLERQTTLYDDHSHYDGYCSDGRIGKMSATYPECQTDIGYNKYYDNITGYMYQDERYGQDDEDRQWDSGGRWYSGSSTYYENKRNRKTLPQRPASSIGIHRPDYRPTVTRQRSYESEELNYSWHRRKMLQPQQRSFSRQEGTGKKLPPTPTKKSNVILGRKPASLPTTPGRQLPCTRTPSEESYYKSEYNEDYNYAYRSQDNLPQDIYTDNVYTDESFNQVHITGTVPDNQYVADYVPQTFHKDGYQQPFDQTNVHAYQGAYDDTTYPKISESNDQYDKTQDIIMQDNYQNLGYDQDDSQQLYQDTYHEPYTEYDATVPTSAYDQNNVHTYDQYQQNQYDNQYNVDTSTTYADTYQESYGNIYNQTPVTTSQETYQESYQDTYKSQDEYQDDSYHVPLSKEEDINMYDQDQYQSYPEQYDESYQDSYQGSFDEQQYKDSNQIEAMDGRRMSEVPELSVTTPRGQTRANGYPSANSDYYYPSKDSQETSSVDSARRRKFGKRDASPLIQQNTDSLESRDDELKNSFETAVSSVNSSQYRKGYSEYSTAGESSPALANIVDSPQSSAQLTSTAVMNHTVTNHVSGVITTTAVVHSTAVVNGKRLMRTESYQEEVMEEELLEEEEPYQEYPEIIPKEPRRKDSQLSHHSQQSQHSSTHSQKPKLTRGDSYASDHFPEDSYGRRDSYAQPGRKDSYSSITQDGFKPPLNRTDSYQKRGSYGQNYIVPQPISRAESYQRGHFKDQDSIDDTEIVLSNAVNGDFKMRDETLERYERGEEALIRASRENSLIEPYKGTPPTSDSPRGSIIKQESLEKSVQMDTPPRSPPEPPPDDELLEMVNTAPIPTQLKERPEMTAKQRWHWAYNKIIIQLNVSKKQMIIRSSTVDVCERRR